MVSQVQFCAHIHPGGRRCCSPALRNQRLCYFHRPAHRPAGPRLRTMRPGYRWYALQRRAHLLDRAGVTQTITDMARATLTGDITPRQSRRLIEALGRRTTILNRQQARLTQPQ